MALSGINESNRKSMVSMVESYHKMVVPGLEEGENDAEQEAREVLAVETKKIFAVKPAADPIRAAKEMAADPRSASLSRHFVKNKKIFDHKEMISRASRKK